MEFFLLSLISFCAAFINSISGGGGLLATSSLLAFGIPPFHVLVYNRLIDVGTLAGAIHNYYKSRYIDWKIAFLSVFPFSLER